MNQDELADSNPGVDKALLDLLREHLRDVSIENLEPHAYSIESPFSGKSLAQPSFAFFDQSRK